MTTAFWLLCFSIVLRNAIAARWERLRAVIVVAFSGVLAVANSNQFGPNLMFHQHLSVSAASVLLAGKTGQENEKLKFYWAYPELVMKPLPMLIAAKKDIFGQDVGRRFMASEPQPAGDIPLCQGSFFRMPRYDEPGILGFAGRSTSPTGKPLDYVLLYGPDGMNGVGFPTFIDVGSNPAQEAKLLSGYRRFVFRHAPAVSAAYNIGVGWVGLARMQGRDVIAIGWGTDGPCRINSG